MVEYLIHSKNTDGLTTLSDILTAPILDDNTIIYAYNANNEIIGAIAINISNIYDFKNHSIIRYGVIEYIASRQKGVGTILMQASEQWFRDHITEMTHTIIHVISLKTSIGFYLTMGFHLCPFNENYPGLHIMQKNIV